MIPDPHAEGNIAKFIRTGKKSKTLLFNRAGRNAYKISSRNDTKIYWDCRSKNSDKCMARAITDGNHVKKWNGLHNHPSNIFESDVVLENHSYFAK